MVFGAAPSVPLQSADGLLVDSAPIFQMEEPPRMSLESLSKSVMEASHLFLLPVSSLRSFFSLQMEIPRRQGIAIQNWEAWALARQRLGILEWQIQTLVTLKP